MISSPTALSRLDLLSTDVMLAAHYLIARMGPTSLKPPIFSNSRFSSRTPDPRLIHFVPRTLWRWHSKIDCDGYEHRWKEIVNDFQRFLVFCKESMLRLV
jgi:hypothetical protein